MRLSQDQIKDFSEDLKREFHIYYKQAFNAEPHIDEDEMTHLRWFVQQLPYPRCKELLKHYTTMREDWFRQNGYNLRTFKNKLQAIILDHGMKQPKGQAGFNPMVFRTEECDMCAKTFDHYHRALESPMPPILCKECS